MLVCIAVGALRPTGIFRPPGGTTGATPITAIPTKTNPITANPIKATTTNSLLPLDAGTPDADKPNRPNWALDAGGSMEAPTAGGALDINLAPANQMVFTPYNLRNHNVPDLQPHHSPSPALPSTAGMLGGQLHGRVNTRVAKGPGVPPGYRFLGVHHPAGVQKPRKASKLLKGRGGYNLTVCAHVVCHVTWCL